MQTFRSISKKRNASPSKKGNHQVVDRVAEGPMVNGLPTIPEVPSIDVDMGSVAPFSMPQEMLAFAPTEEEIMTSFKNGVKERKVFCNIELTEGEQENLRKLQDEARSQNQAFLPSVASAAMRYVSRARGDPKKALKEMLATQAWRQSYFKNGPLTTAAVAEDLQHGIVYWTGRDKSLRPALVVRPARIPAAWYKNNASEKLTRLLVFSLEYMLRYLTYPGKVETSTIIIDLSGCTLSQVPLSSLREICTVLSLHYILRVHKFYICNAPAAIQRMSGMALRLLTEKQRQKLTPIQTVQDLRQDFALHQLEEQYGGSRPATTTFFPFDLQAGPFNAGCSMGANAEAIPNVHRAFTAAGIYGRAWEPSLSKEQNLELEYTESAANLFRQCGTPFPKTSVDREESNHGATVVLACDDVIPVGATLVAPRSEDAAVEALRPEVRTGDKRDTSPIRVRTPQNSDMPVLLGSQGPRCADVMKASGVMDAGKVVEDSLTTTVAFEGTAAVAIRPDQNDTSMDLLVDSEQVRPAAGFLSCMVCRSR